MKKIQLSIAAGLVLALGLSSCSKTGPTGPAGSNGATGNPGPALTGTVTGYVDLFDQYGDLASAANGVMVTIPTVPTASASTGNTGMYSIPGLSTGTYELDFTLSNYGSTKINSLNFVGGGTQYISGHVQMAQVPSFSIATTSGLTATTNTVNSNIALVISMASADTKARKVAVFFSNSSSVSSAPGSYMGWASVTIPPNTTTGNATFTSSGNFYPAGLVSGSTAYFAVYPISYNTGASAFPDPSTGKTIFNNVFTGSSATANAMVP